MAIFSAFSPAQRPFHVFERDVIAFAQMEQFGELDQLPDVASRQFVFVCKSARNVGGQLQALQFGLVSEDGVTPILVRVVVFQVDDSPGVDGIVNDRAFIGG